MRIEKLKNCSYSKFALLFLVIFGINIAKFFDYENHSKEIKKYLNKLKKNKFDLSKAYFKGTNQRQILTIVVEIITSILIIYKK